MMTEPGARSWFRRRQRENPLAGLTVAVVIPPVYLFQRSDPNEDSVANQVGIVIAIVVAVILGLVLVAHLIRPLFGRPVTEQPVDTDQDNNDHDERWARWEAGNATNTPIPTDQPGFAPQPGEEMMSGSAPAVERPPDQAPPANEISPNGAIGASVFATVSALIGCANDGAMLSGFGLYSDRFFHQFALESGLSLDEFVRRYQSLGSRQGADRLHVDRIDNMVNLPDGRISARIIYGPAGALPPERYLFAWSPDRNRWLIDDIQDDRK